MDDVRGDLLGLPHGTTPAAVIANITLILGTELLVWYGQEYARELGMIRDKNLLLVPKYINGEGMGYRTIGPLDLQ